MAGSSPPAGRGANVVDGVVVLTGASVVGVVVGVVKRGWRPYVCVLDPESGLGGNYLAEPLDQRIPRINIR